MTAAMIASTISAAVEEQGIATAEMAKNVHHTTESTRALSTTIAGVSQAANDTGAAASQVLNAATDLSRQAEQVTSEVQTFVSSVRAA